MLRRTVKILSSEKGKSNLVFALIFTRLWLTELFDWLKSCCAWFSTNQTRLDLRRFPLASTQFILIHICWLLDETWRRLYFTQFSYLLIINPWQALYHQSHYGAIFKPNRWYLTLYPRWSVILYVVFWLPAAVIAGINVSSCQELNEAGCKFVDLFGILAFGNFPTR